jgi:hypothetical protein
MDSKVGSEFLIKSDKLWQAWEALFQQAFLKTERGHKGGDD